MELLPPLSLAQRVVAAGLVCFSEPDAFGLASEAWTTPHSLTYALLGLLVLGVFGDRRLVPDQRESRGRRRNRDRQGMRTESAR